VGAAPALTAPLVENGRVGRHRRVETTFRVLFVCTGNICRSPVAEIVTRHLLIGGLGGRAASAFRVSSAGVQAVVGAPVHPYMLTELAPLGLDREAERFVARQFVPEFIESADLVLGAEPRHRSTVVERAPGALPITFGLREFARLAASVDSSALPAAPVARAHMLVERARDRRGLVPPVEPEDDVIPDPIGGPQAAHHNAMELIKVAVATIVKIVIPAGR
jgi:protein-tyrosine phosphatase